MNAESSEQKLYFLLGCTAAGKGALGRALARRIGGHIVSVDSMKIYRRMDIGTAKPSADLLVEIPHECIDLVEPWEPFSVARYVEHADRAIGRIRSAGSIPLAVGGTSLYIQALWRGLFDGPPADPEFRQAIRRRAAEEGLDRLHEELRAVDAEAASRIHPNDEKRIVRALEVYHATQTPISELQKQWTGGQARYDCVFIGVRRQTSDLHSRINRRVKEMIDAGLRDEAASLLADPRGMSPQAAQAVGYAEMIDHLRGRRTLDETTERIKINTRRLAKRQRTWQRRWPEVRWFDVGCQDTAEGLTERILAEIRFV